MLSANLVTLSIVLTGTAFAQAGECALVVRLVWMDGRTPSDGRVTLRGPQEQVLESKHSSMGKVEFCDLPQGLHSITVGEGECGTTRVSGLRYRPGYSQTIRVVMNSCVGYPQGGFPPACGVYLRIRSRAGELVPDAIVQFTGSSKANDQFKGDKYGRVVFALLEGSARTFRLTAPGFEPQEVELRCNRQLDIEKELLLEPTRPSR